MRAVTGSAELRSFASSDLGEPLHPLGTIELPMPYEPTDPTFLHSCAERVREAATPRRRRSASRPVASEAELALRAHPLHSAPARERLVAAYQELQKVRAEIHRLETSATRRSTSLAVRFDSVLDVMNILGALHDWSLTSTGRLVASLYHECDMAIALALQRGVFDGLDPPAFAAALSTFTYEERRPDPPRPPAPPSAAVMASIGSIEAIVGEIQGVERSRGVRLTRSTDRGFIRLADEWVRGRPLTEATESLSAGDFVRNIKVLIDLSGQIATAAPHRGTRAVAREAVELMARGVVTADLEGGEGLR